MRCSVAAAAAASGRNIVESRKKDSPHLFPLAVLSTAHSSRCSLLTSPGLTEHTQAHTYALKHSEAVLFWPLSPRLTHIHTLGLLLLVSVAWCPRFSLSPRLYLQLPSFNCSQCNCSLLIAITITVVVVVDHHLIITTTTTAYLKAHHRQPCRTLSCETSTPQRH